MAKKSKKALGAAMAGVMAVGAVAGANTMAAQVQADVAADVKAADAKLNHLANSLHNNYLGLKNQPTWELYAKEAKVLIAKLPNGSTKEKFQARLDRANAMILAAASVNHAEFSIQKNYPKADNANQWIAYADKSLANINIVEKGGEYTDRLPVLQNRIEKVKNFAAAVLDLEEARENEDVESMVALKEDAADLMDYFEIEMNYKGLMKYNLVDVIDQRIEEAGGLVEDDTEAPVLSYDGEKAITVENGAKFEVPTVTATDDVDEEVEVKAVIKDATGKEIDAIDTKVAGTYTVTYTATDAAGNVSDKLVITVTVKEADSKLAVKSVNAVNAKGEKTALDGAIVSRNSTYEIEFNGEFDPATITSTTIKLVKGTETMAISQPTTNKNVVSFNSLSTLEAGAEYKLVVDGVKSKDGKSTISDATLAKFKAAETVVTKKVTANGTKIFDATTNDGVSLNVIGDWSYGAAGSVIQVELDTPVDKSTINSSTIQLVDVATGKNLAVEGNQVVNSNYLNIKIVGSSDYLVPKHQYKLVLDGLKAANGKAVDAFSVKFAYQADKPQAVDTATIYNGDLKPIANTVDGLVNPLTSQRMLDNGTTFKAAAAVTVDFGAAAVKLDESTVTTDYIYIREKDTKKKVSQSIAYNKELNRVTLTPTERLKDDTTYEIFQSPYMKNIFGVSLGNKDSDFKTADFKTLDVTAPSVVGQPESTLENKGLNALPLDKNFKIRVKMSEKIGNVSLVDSIAADAYSKFATAAIDGNILVTRADDEKITAKAVKADLVSAEKVIIGTDQYVELTINPSDIADIKGKTFRVTFAGSNPTRKNVANKVITDSYGVVANALANDYSFTFSFAGEDKTAPKVTDVSGSYDGNKLAGPLQGMTNVNQGKMRVFFDSNDVNAATIPNIKLVDKNNAEISATLIGSVVKTGNTSYADISFVGAANGAAVLKIQDVADTSGNRSTLQTYDLKLGNGLKVTSAKFVKTSDDDVVADKAEDSVVRIDIAGSIDKTSLAGNVKLLEGTTEVETTIDSSKDGYIRLVPKTPLKSGVQYKVVVGKDVKNTDGNLLQQSVTSAPADFSVNLTTVSSDSAKLVSTLVDESARTITLTFDKNIKTVDANVILKNFSGSDVEVDNDSAEETPKFVEIDGKKVIITVHKKLDAKVDYQGEITVTDKGNIQATAKFSALTTKEWKLDDNLSKPVVDTIATAGSKFTLTFSEQVKTSEVKSALKVYNATEDKNVMLFDSSFIATGGTESGYAKVFEVNIPGYNGDNEYIVSFAKESISDYAGFKNAKAYDASIKAVAAGQALQAATQKVEALEIATADTVDLSNDEKNAAAVAAKTDADAALNNLDAGADKDRLQDRITAANAFITAANTAETLVEAAENASATAVTTTNKTNIDAAETKIKAVVYTGANSATTEALEARVATAKDNVAKDADFVFAINRASDSAIKITFSGSEVTTGIDKAGGYTVAVEDTDKYGSTASVSEVGSVTLTLNSTDDTSNTFVQTITITNDFWNKTATKTITITDKGAGTLDTFAVDVD